MIEELRKLNELLTAMCDTGAAKTEAISRLNVDFSKEADAKINDLTRAREYAIAAFALHAEEMQEVLSRLLVREAERRDDQPLIRQQIDFVMPTLETTSERGFKIVDVEDGGAARIFQPDVDDGAVITGDDDGHLFVRIQSWDEETKEHPLFTKMMGRRVRLILEAYGD